MSTVLVTVHIEAKGSQARSKLLGIIDKVIEHARTEIGVLRYIVGLPIRKDSGKDIYVIEEYATEDARQAHLASKELKVLLEELGPDSETIASAPEIHVLPPSSSFHRPGQKDISEAEIVILAHFGYQPGFTTHSLEGWKAIVDNCEANEPPVLAYAVMEDKEDNMIRTVEVYTSIQFSHTTHLESEAVRLNQEQNGADRDGRKGVVKLEPVAGFLGR